MNVLIIEDETYALLHLENLLKKYDNSIEILNRFDTIKRASEWLKTNPGPDLIFMDIQLADGLSFEIFERVEVNTPIIFTTAYNEYALRAFKVNSIDYLLKPLDFEELSSAIEKFKRNSTKPKNPEIPSKVVFDKVLQMLTNQYKSRFMIKIGSHIRTISIEDICYFYSMEKFTFLQNTQNQSFPIDYSLDEAETLTDPQKYFRINRKYLIQIDSISDISVFSNSRLKLKLKNCSDDDVIVSREKVQDFKKWLDR
jgi:DNA-binding LytR/AlgR family response regulator